MYQVKTVLVVLLSVMVAACSQHHSLIKPQNQQEQFYTQAGDDGLDFKQASNINALYSLNKSCFDEVENYSPKHYRVDAPLLLPGGRNNQSRAAVYGNPKNLSRNGLPLSPGDLLELTINNGEGFSGKYVVDNQGLISIPYIAAVAAAGFTLEEISKNIELALVRQQIFRANTALVQLRVLHWSDISVSVSGAVFAPGQVRINQKIAEQVIDQKLGAIGDFSSRRLLSEALRSASGIRPDAKLDQVILLRNGWQMQLDLSGIFTGRKTDDLALVAGDQIIVPSIGCFQPHLVRPSQITPKGFRIFLSNLVDSAFNNSSAAVGRFSSNMPYGSRLLQAAVSANCIGGKQLTNAPRKVLLASNNPLTGKVQVIERSVEQLMRFANRDLVNPYLMPNDAVACYDSDLTNLRDLAKSLVDLISPLKLL